MYLFLNRIVHPFVKLLPFFLFFLSSSSYAQQRDFRKEALLLRNTILQRHYKPKTIDDQFAQQFYDQLFKVLDPDKIIFAESDLKPFQPYRTLLDDEFNGKQWYFLNLLTSTYRECLKRSEQYVEQLSSAPFNWSVKEYMVNDTLQWPVDEVALKEKWRLWLKYSMLDRLASMHELDSIDSRIFFEKNESIARARVKASELRFITRTLKHQAGFENYVASLYFGVFASIFDPHSAYLSTTEMENFLSSLSTEGYYFGVTLDENDRGDVVITALAPGGPAWKSGEFHTGDVLLALTWAGQERIDLAGVSVEEVNDMLGDTNHNMIEFTIKGAGGIQKVISLRKEKISLEDVFVRSYILNGKKKIGYISLPDFYTQWGDESEGSRCAYDVAKEIMKLKGEGVEGLILDVRFNGGGSLQESLAMASIFIPDSPLGILRGRNQVEQPMNQFMGGVVYNGPLILMVNGQSASASEFLAAALQDYNRAIIAGSRTYGKATAQNFFPLDPNQREGPSLESLKAGVGFATITTDKIYRATGNTAQALGIVPDISLPDFYDVVMMKEAHLPYVLRADSIRSKTYRKSQRYLPIEWLRDKSEKRVASKPSYQLVKETSSWLQIRLREQYKPILLDWEVFLKQSRTDLKKYHTIEKVLGQPTALYKVLNDEMDLKRIDADEYAKNFNKRWIEKLESDQYVEEAFLIAADYIDWMKKNRTNK